MARRRIRPEIPDAEVNLTSMLDVVFNILAYFVMTFNPPGYERNFDASLPPPKQAANAAPAAEGNALDTDEPFDAFKDVTVTLTAGPGGTLAGIQVEQKLVPGGMKSLSGELRALVKSIGGSGDNKLETANIVASPGLKYLYVIQAIDACNQADIRRINFGETGKAPGN